jgi:peptidoglycan DL-endopeptidase CwlO
VEHLPEGRSRKATSWGDRSRRGWGRIVVLAAAASALALALPGGEASARPADNPPTLQTMVNQVNDLSNQIDALSQQYDGLQIQLQQAQAQAASAKLMAQNDEKALKSGKAAVGQIAAMGYMNGSVNSTIQLLQGSSPQAFLNKASVLQQLSYQQTGKISQLSQASAAVARAQKTAAQQTALAQSLSSQMAAKVSAMQSKENLLNSQVYAQALAIFQQTGSYPNIGVTGDTVGAQAVRWALTQLGAPYVWGGAGPYSAGYDCSGLVMAAYEHVGISLAHLTFDQWNEGEHVSESDLQPGDLVFFFGLDHVGLYIGNGMMVDAPTFGQVVKIDPVWGGGAFDGAVRIA